MTDLSPAEFKRRLRQRARTEGAEIAYEAAIAICKDPTAPAQAKSAALNAIFRVGGYFEADEDEDTGKELYQMSAEELAREIQASERRLAALRAGTSDDEADVMD